MIGPKEPGRLPPRMPGGLCSITELMVLDAVGIYPYAVSHIAIRLLWW